MENRIFTTGMVRTFDRAKAEQTRTVEFVISDETRDRHRTVIPLSAWNIDRFNANGIVGYQHEVHGSYTGNSNPDQVLGIGEAYFEDGKLIGRVTFEPADINPLAEKIFQKVLHGTLKATSVGFIENERGEYGKEKEARGAENETYYFKNVELLEFSIVNIPSNPNALRRTLEQENELAEERRLRTGAENLVAELKRTIEQQNDKIVTLKQNLRLAKMKK